MLARKLALLRTLRRIGWRRVALVAHHRRLKRKGFYVRACPIGDWQIAPELLKGARSPYVPAEPTAVHEVTEAADRIVAGELCWFSWKWGPKPDDWNAGPNVHWSTLSEFDSMRGDVKWDWEPSRFDWAVTLGRAFVTTGDDRYQAKFIELLSDWRHHNPPNQGLNWYCGQECSLRILALVFAAGVFPAANELIWGTVAKLAERVEPSIGYAIGQHNNHGISEATGLYLAGVCLPDHPAAAHWKALGKLLLEDAISMQFEADGGYIQSSFVYQRLAIRCCLACFFAGRKCGDVFSQGAQERVAQSARMLAALMVGENGRLPNYGANDGANELALSCCAYLDFRPIVQLASAMLTGERAFEAGPWDEELAWFDVDASKLPTRKIEQEEKFLAAESGYLALRSASVTAFMRVPKYTSGRPSQADALHVDIWWDGQPVAIDSGTYSYNDSRGWWKHFRSTAAHNTVVVDGLDQMPSASRFLFTDWTECMILEGTCEPDGQIAFHSPTGDVTYVAGSPALGGMSRAYAQIGHGLVHERYVSWLEGVLQVVDVLRGPGVHQAELNWHLAGFWEQAPGGAIRVAAPGVDALPVTVLSDQPDMELSLRSGDEPECVHSERYGELLPLTLLTARITVRGSATFVTSFGASLASEDEP